MKSNDKQVPDQSKQDNSPKTKAAAQGMTDDEFFAALGAKVSYEKAGTTFVTSFKKPSVKKPSNEEKQDDHENHS